MHKSFARDIRSVLRVDAHVIYRENSNVWIRYLVGYGVRYENFKLSAITHTSTAAQPNR